MRKLLSLPPNLVRLTPHGDTVFHHITGLTTTDYFCTCDPQGQRVGSGGGTAWLLAQCHADEDTGQDFSQWLQSEKRILLHAGGQGRRLPAYAPSGKVLTPVPVVRWERGQRLGQDLLSMQMPLYETIAEMAPEGLNTLIVNGDVLIRTSQPLPPVPRADVVCYGIWLPAVVACNHGVFVSDSRRPQVLKQMLQKPSVEKLNTLQSDHYYLTDIGVWLLSDRAVSVLMKRSGADAGSLLFGKDGAPRFYDLYSDFGPALGTHPTVTDDEIASLTVATVPLDGGEFYHFGTSRQMIESTLALQNVVVDQRHIMHHDRKPHPSMFVQNSLMSLGLTSENTNVWIENSCVGRGWSLSHDHVITGVPQNDWHLTLSPGQCIDMVPVGDTAYAVRPYMIDDRFDGALQQKEQFPVVEADQAEAIIGRWIETGLTEAPHGTRLLSAEQISAEANLERLFAQRRQYRRNNWSQLADNWRHSVFYQLDLDDAATHFAREGIDLPRPLPDDAPLMLRVHNAMLRGQSDQAFGLLRQGLMAAATSLPQRPQMSVCPDQIVWARSPVRIDIAGGWTDTPPFCLLEGGSVVNLAIELNGQPPLQAYVKPSAERRITLRSIDLGATEVVDTYEQLQQFNRVGSPFSIPKAALALAGFVPQFATEKFVSLKEQLEDFGCGIELTLLSAVPAGSGLGTSSILAATVLGALSEFCALGWDKNEIGRRTLALEQMLTTGGGWQDQFGGLLGGVKLLQSTPGFDQDPQARWLPTQVFDHPEHRQCHLLYYTGMTRTAKHILAEIVRRMFLNNCDQLRLLRSVKQLAYDMHEAIQKQDLDAVGRLVKTSWQQNQMLDSGTNPDAIRRLTALVDDLCVGYKLPGAGGGGFLYMVAKDPEAAVRIRQVLTRHAANDRARFVDMSLSANGLQTSRS